MIIYENRIVFNNNSNITYEYGTDFFLYNYLDLRTDFYIISSGWHTFII